ncbi:DMP19 family protein [Mucilaginibacter sp. RS28]|uniref:DMP19 family protein n=1 Tax=Mucilaginibacter straminoryzae TaxID=2932774 RepID=A0A9X1X4X2_9SPHI|nr:DUF4375 domain-containing protein [Mucilaginibacter straminoryzae]MCJ8208714.1 DMP19 family protein [Mucilaginibacter straminoryzae]
MNSYQIFDKENHIKPDIDNRDFENNHLWDFGWLILEPINIADDQEDEKLLSKRLSPGQKAIYFFWYLDGQVTNGGFIQFYFNGYRIYLEAIKTGLKLIGDDNLLNLLDRADHLYLTNQTKFEKQVKVDKIEPLYKEITPFDDLDTKYYELHEYTMQLIENYARACPEEFCNLV